MESIYNNADTPRSSSVLDPSIQKSIQRNRMKAMKKQTSDLGSSRTSSTSRNSEISQRMEALREAREKRLGKGASLPKSTIRGEAPLATAPISSNRTRSSRSNSRPASKTRKTLPASFEEIEFVEPVVKRKKRASVVKYKTKTKKKDRGSKLYKFAWAFMGLLVIRLIFVDGGVIDYYQKESLLNDREEQLQRTIQENEQLGLEIKRIKSDRSYQKRLVRDNLGMIGKDEYLVLFQKD